MVAFSAAIWLYCHTTLYHTAGNGNVECFNHVFLSMLRSHKTKQNRWPKYLVDLVYITLLFRQPLQLPVDTVLPTHQKFSGLVCAKAFSSLLNG